MEVSGQLDVPHVEMDSIADRYFEDCPDFDVEVFRGLARQPDGFLAQVRYWGTAGIYALERALVDHRDCVFDLGAGYTWYLSSDLQKRVGAALASFDHVVLMLPSIDPAESVRILRDRSWRTRGQEWVHDGIDFIQTWVCDGQNEQLATIRVTTRDRTPEQIARTLLAGIR